MSPEEFERLPENSIERQLIHQMIIDNSLQEWEY
jgi:hypothetical protein